MIGRKTAKTNMKKKREKKRNRMVLKNTKMREKNKDEIFNNQK